VGEGKGGRRRRRLWRLWKSDPHCRWCGRPTVFVFRPPGQRRGAAFLGHEAALDHLHGRVNGRRRATAEGEERTVLACRKCNLERGAAEVVALPASHPPRLP
jgi:hypothetical protein